MGSVWRLRSLEGVGRVARSAGSHHARRMKTYENATHASLPCLLWIFRRHVACNHCSGSSNLQTAHNLKRPHTISHLELAGLHPMHVHLPGIATSNNWQPKLHLVCYEVKTADYGTRFRDLPPSFHAHQDMHKGCSIKGFKASCWMMVRPVLSGKRSARICLSYGSGQCVFPAIRWLCTV